MIKNKLVSRSWGQQIKSKNKVRAAVDYRKCPYPSCQSDFGKGGAIACVVGYNEDLEKLIVCCPVCLHLSTIHGMDNTFRLLERNAQPGQIYKKVALEFLCFPETYDAMRQCIEEVLGQYKRHLKIHLEWLNSKLGYFPSINYDPTWDLGSKIEKGQCFGTAENLELLRDYEGITEYEVRILRREIRKELFSRKDKDATKKASRKKSKKKTTKKKKSKKKKVKKKN